MLAELYCFKKQIKVRMHIAEDTVSATCTRVQLLLVCYFPIGILDQVCYLIVSSPDLCPLSYFYILHSPVA